MAGAYRAVRRVTGPAEVEGTPPRPTVTIGLEEPELRLPPLILCALATACSPQDSPAPQGPEDGPRLEITSTACEPEDRSPHYQRVPLPYEPLTIAYLWSGGTSVGDVDGDGDKDVLLHAFDGPVLYRNPDWEPEPIARTDALVTSPSATVLLDIDADGDLDLFLGRYGSPDALLLNDGTGRFEDVTDTRMPGGHAGMTVAASFADIDHDGDLDGLVLSMGQVLETPIAPFTSYPPARDAHLWINQGDGTFRDEGAQLPDEVHHGYTLAGGLHDLDRDGHIDLFAVNDFGPIFGGNQWMAGHGDGTFGLPQNPGHGLGFATSAMGLALADLNEDGIDDIAVPYYGGVSIHESFGEGPSLAWFDTTDLHITEPMPADYMAWGGLFADVDNDGDVDLQVSAGRLDTLRWSNPPLQSNRLYLQEEGEEWPERSADWGLDSTDQSRGAIFADLDMDGSLDLIQASLDAPAVYMSACSDHASIQISLRQPGPNPRAIGAEISLLNGPLQRQTLRAGGTSFASSGPAEAHFGLGSLETADLRIDWPDGDATTLHDLPARSAITVHRDPEDRLRAEVD